MKTRNLLITLGITAMATFNLMADVALSPRAIDNQSKVIAGTNKDPDRTAANPLPASPRFFENQIKTVAGKDTSAAASCHEMNGSPKEIGVCAEHPGASMPCCGGSAANK